MVGIKQSANKEEYRLVLASQSPQRRELLEQIGIIPHEIIAPNVDEAVEKLQPSAYVERTAHKKLMTVAEMRPDCFCLAADTAVVVGRKILGKPDNIAEARHFLQLLSGRRHQVFTAVAVISPHNPRALSRIVRSRVKFRALTSQMIDDYIAANEWQGRAGGYAIQGYGGQYITWITGSYSGIMGLPLFETTQLLRGLGFPITANNLGNQSF